MKTAQEQLDIVSTLVMEEGVGGVLALLSLHCKIKSKNTNSNRYFTQYSDLLEKMIFRACVIEGWQPFNDDILELNNKMFGGINHD